MSASKPSNELKNQAADLTKFGNQSLSEGIAL
jgi:hypothetical protein